MTKTLDIRSPLGQLGWSGQHKLLSKRGPKKTRRQGPEREAGLAPPALAGFYDSNRHQGTHLSPKHVGRLRWKGGTFEPSWGSLARSQIRLKTKKGWGEALSKALGSVPSAARNKAGGHCACWGLTGIGSLLSSGHSALPPRPVPGTDTVGDHRSEFIRVGFSWNRAGLARRSGYRCWSESSALRRPKSIHP